MSKKYDLLILDYGGVYSFDYDPASFNQIMLDVFGRLPNEQEKERIVAVATLLGTNKTTAEDYVDRVARIMQSPIPDTQTFEDAVVSHGFPPSAPMVELVKKVRANDIKVSLLSDIYLFELERMRPTGRYEGFDHTSFSSEIGYMKTSPEAFMAMLRHFEVKPEKTLFVDDVLTFIEHASTLGMDTLWANKANFKSAEQLADAISKRMDLP
jgi:HAD superfamily hydrolase (TIGR01509 family)